MFTRTTMITRSLLILNGCAHHATVRNILGRLSEMDAITFQKPKSHADGIYFGLDKEAYLDDPALGSSDMKMLAFSPCDYWWTRLSPARSEKESTPAQETGTAVHLAVLEGAEAFEKLYMRGPDQDGMTTSEKTQSTKNANAEAKELGKVSLKAPDYDRCRIAAAMIIKNPKLSTCFSGGAAEVSVFWTEYKPGAPGNQLRKKARFDYLKPRGVGDLKKVANQHEIPFPRACINAITNYSYHVQAKHYLDARAVMPRLIAAQCYFSFLVDDIALISAISAEKQFAFQWVFWQGDRAPITWSRIISPENPMCEIAQRVIERAEQNYLSYMTEFGPDNMWIDFAEPEELFVDDMPPWFARD